MNPLTKVMKVTLAATKRRKIKIKIKNRAIKS
jgi:hypothetical protein